MVANYQQDATIEIKNYLWDRLSNREVVRVIEQPGEGTLNDLSGGSSTRVFLADAYKDNTTGEQYIPIIPVQQSQLFKEKFGTKKHIVYDKIGIAYSDNWMVCEEMILYQIYSAYYSDVTEIVNFMIDEFRRSDDSAKDINRSTLILNNFKFHSIYVTDLTPTEPSTEQLGMLCCELVLTIKYSRITDNEGRFT